MNNRFQYEAAKNGLIIEAIEHYQSKKDEDDKPKCSSSSEAYELLTSWHNLYDEEWFRYGQSLWNMAEEIYDECIVMWSRTKDINNQDEFRDLLYYQAIAWLTDIEKKPRNHIPLLPFCYLIYNEETTEVSSESVMGRKYNIIKNPLILRWGDERINVNLIVYYEIDTLIDQLSKKLTFSGKRQLSQMLADVYDNWETKDYHLFANNKDCNLISEEKKACNLYFYLLDVYRNKTLTKSLMKKQYNKIKKEYPHLFNQ